MKSGLSSGSPSPKRILSSLFTSTNHTKTNTAAVLTYENMVVVEENGGTSFPEQSLSRRGRLSLDSTGWLLRRHENHTG